MSEQKTYETFTLNHKPELVISGLLGRREPRVRMVDTQKGPLTLTDFSIRVDLAKGDDGRYVKEAVYLNVSVRGDYKAQLVACRFILSSFAALRIAHKNSSLLSCGR